MKKGSEEGAGVGGGARLGWEEGVPLRVVNGASSLLPQQVGVRAARNETYPRGFLDENNVGKGGFEEGLKVFVTLMDVHREDGEVVRH